MQPEATPLEALPRIVIYSYLGVKLVSEMRLLPNINNRRQRVSHYLNSLTLTSQHTHMVKKKKKYTYKVLSKTIIAIQPTENNPKKL